MSPSPGWTTVADLTATVRKRWDRGIYLRAHAAGEAFEPVRLPVRGPSAVDLRDELDAVIAWAERFRRDSGEAAGRPRFAVERRVVKGRGMGANELPSAVVIEHFGQLVSLLGAAAGNDVSRLDAVLALTGERADSLVPWVVAHPHEAIGHHDVWPELLATVEWVASHDTATRYLRHLDVADVDTKFVERHQKILTQLLTVVLPSERVDPTARDFVGRFGFKPKPGFTRLRLPPGQTVFPSAVTEVRLRTDELAALELPVRTVFVVENEVSYLALPSIPDAVIVFGEGSQSATLEQVPWLAGKEIVYWGDIDTHGFAILDRLRARFPTVASILMDHDTLLAHPRQYVTEPSPTTAPLPHLTDAEAALYHDLIEDRFGPSVRLEQERIRFSLVRQALAPWSNP